MKNLVLFFKSHIDTFTRKDGSVVQAHDDKRQAAKPDADERHVGVVHGIKNTMSGHRVVTIDGVDHATLDDKQDWKVGDQVKYSKKPTAKWMGTSLPHTVSDIKKHE